MQKDEEEKQKAKAASQARQERDSKGAAAGKGSGGKSKDGAAKGKVSKGASKGGKADGKGAGYKAPEPEVELAPAPPGSWAAKMAKSKGATPKPKAKNGKLPFNLDDMPALSSSAAPKQAAATATWGKGSASSAEQPVASKTASAARAAATPTPARAVVEDRDVPDAWDSE